MRQLSFTLNKATAEVRAIVQEYGTLMEFASGRAQRRLQAWRLHAGGPGRVAVCQGDGEAVEADTGRDYIDANFTLRPSVSGHNRL